MVRDLIEKVLIALLDKSGVRWKSASGLLLAALGLAAAGIDVGWNVLPEWADPWITWVIGLGSGLAGIGIYHKAARAEQALEQSRGQRPKDSLN